MTVAGWLLDGLLALVLLALALRILQVTNLFNAVVLFICLGLLMALAWVRLEAPDVALAEAGIGAGLTGVLLVDMLHKLSWGAHPRTASFLRDQKLTGGWPSRLLGGSAAAGVLILLGLVLFEPPAEEAGLAAEVAARLDQTGVSHGVTAVLLDFRSLDTLLEIAVLFVSVLGVLAVRRGQRHHLRVTAPTAGDAVVDWLPRVLLPLLILVAGYLLWLGSTTAGGAFQSGIVLAAALVLLALTGRRPLDGLPAWAWQALLVAGLAALLVVGGSLLLLGRGFLDYPEGWATALILLLEALAAVSIGVMLATLFLGLGGAGPDPQRQREER